MTFLRLLALATLPAWAAEDANEIVKRFIEAQNKNWESAREYAYIELADYFGFDKRGRPRKDRSETHEVIFVEGLTYKKLTARNGKPLEGKEQAREETKLQRTAAERRKQRRSGVFRKTFSLGSDRDLLTLFDNRLVGEEEVRGRQAWMIECTPRQDRNPVNAHEREVLSFKRRLWIDQAEYVLLRSIYTVVGRQLAFMPGSTITWEFEKINEDTWLATFGIVDGRVRFLRVIRPAVRTEYRNYGFRKFDVQSTITLEPVK